MVDGRTPMLERPLMLHDDGFAVHRCSIGIVPVGKQYFLSRGLTLSLYIVEFLLDITLITIIGHRGTRITITVRRYGRRMRHLAPRADSISNSCFRHRPDHAAPAPPLGARGSRMTRRWSKSRYVHRWFTPRLCEPATLNTRQLVNHSGVNILPSDTWTRVACRVT